MPDDETHLFAQKKELRQKIRHKLALLTLESQQKESSHLVRQLADFLKKRNLETAHIAVFAACGTEIDLSSLHKELPLASFYYPLCHKGNLMSFHRISFPDQELRPGYRGLLEPSEDIPAVEPEKLDVIIVPGLAFTQKGHRLGKGCGFYDRYLSRNEVKALLLGVSFSCQIVEDIPSTSQDKQVHHVFSAE